MDIDGEDEEDASYEEYTWAGQTRVRVTTMLEGGLAGQPCVIVVICQHQFMLH